MDALAEHEPIFRLPDAVHSHIRAYMPAPSDKTLIFDAFFRLGADAEMIVMWPGAHLTTGQQELAVHLLDRIGYLGRAESWAEGRVAADVTGEFNCAPRARNDTGIAETTERTRRLPATNLVPVDITLSLAPSAWAERRKKLLDELGGRKVPRGKRVAAEATLPERLADALAVDTSAWQAAGWSSPPPLRKVVYDGPPVGPLPPIRPRRPAPASDSQPGREEVARFVLAGRPAPMIEEALRIGDLARIALMSKFDKGAVPSEISGRDVNGPLRDDPQHAHAFYLPEDADGDGRIDHLVVYCRHGFSPAARRALDRLTALWFERGPVDEETGERARKEWRLALEDIAAPEAFAQASALLGRSTRWRSTTPLFKARFDRKPPRTTDALVETYRAQILDEWTQRFGGPPPGINAVFDDKHPGRFSIRIGGGPRSPLAFVRTRQGRGGRRADMSGGFFDLVFDDDVPGPIALGWGSHFGLGLFAGG